jgi:hypothetical protein
VWLVRVIVTVGFFIPAAALVLYPETLREGISAITGWALGWSVLYTIKHQHHPKVKRFLERF